MLYCLSGDGAWVRRSDVLCGKLFLVKTAPILETSRLQFFEFTEGDAPFVLELLNEPAFIRDIGDKGVRTLEDARTYLQAGPLASYQKHGFGLYRVTSKLTGEAIGMCGLLKREVLEHPDLGYALLERYWFQGYAIEAAQAVMRHAHERLRLHEVLAITALENPASVRVLEKLGFTFRGVIPLAGFDAPSRLFAWHAT